MANRARDWTAPRSVDERSDKRRFAQLDWHQHDCRRVRCAAQGRLRGDENHYPHKGAICHSRGETADRCPIHGDPLQQAGSHEFGNRYLHGLCYQCLPPHQADCPMASIQAMTAWLLAGNEMSCFCPSRLSLLGLQVVKCKCPRCQLRKETGRLRIGAVFSAT